MTEATREGILRAYEGARVADVRDGLDTLGLFWTGSMDPQIRPLWPARASGIAKTARYVAYNGPMPTVRGDAYWEEFVGWYYREICPYPWMDELREGDFPVIDQSDLPVGLMGSNNSLGGMKKGIAGYVNNGGARDTDEIILQKIPFWTPRRVQPMVQMRLRFDSMDEQVNVGGTAVEPGDVVVADGDGVVVVPREAAMEVARHARRIHEDDMEGRRRHYEALGMEPDKTVMED